MRGCAHLRNAARGAVNVIGPHGLDRINNHQLRFFSFKRGQNIAQIGFGGQFHRRGGKIKPLGAHADLRAGLFP